MNSGTREHPLITYLEEHVDDRAMLAELRRGLGRVPGEVAGMYPYIIPFSYDEQQDGDLFLIASLFALHPVSSKTGNMGDHLRTYSESVGDDAATTRRFVQLLNLRRPSLDNPLRQHIAILKGKDIPVNWHQLLNDLRYWKHENRVVQKRWASTYWRSSNKQQSKKQS